MRKLTVSEYSEEIGKSKQSIYNRIKRGTLKSDVVDGVSYVYVDDVIKPTVEQPIKQLNTTLKQPFKNVNQSENTKLIFALKKQIKEDKKLLKEYRAEIKSKDKEIKRLNKLLTAEKDVSIDILKQFIGEMKVLSHRTTDIVEPEIIEDDEIKTKSKKKKKKSKK